MFKITLIITSIVYVVATKTLNEHDKTSLVLAETPLIENIELRLKTDKADSDTSGPYHDTSHAHFGHFQSNIHENGSSRDDMERITDFSEPQMSRNTLVNVNITLETMCQSIQPLFKLFRERVENFLSGAAVKAFDFETEAYELDKQLSNISSLFKKFPFSKNLSNQFRLAKHMYLVGKDTRRLLDFQSLTWKESQLVRSLIQINVQILTLHDGYGTPNPFIPDFFERVDRNEDELTKWKASFTTIINMPYSVRMLLEGYLMETEYLLYILKTPNYHRCCNFL